MRISMQISLFDPGADGIGARLLKGKVADPYNKIVAQNAPAQLESGCKTPRGYSCSETERYSSRGDFGGCSFTRIESSGNTERSYCSDYDQDYGCLSE